MLSLLLAAAGAGRVAGWTTWRAEGSRCAARLPPGEVRLTGVVRDPGEAGVPVRFAVDAGCYGDLLLRWPPGESRPAGARVTVEGRWVPRPEGPGGRAGGVVLVRRSRPAPGAVPRALAARGRLFAITRDLYGASAPLVDALLFDRRGAIDPALRDRYAQAGLIHLLSISGFHVGLIVAWALILARGVGLARAPAWVVATGVAIGYVAWLGWPAPATRAAALALLTCVARLRQRAPAWGSLLAATAIGVLLVDPWAVFDLGAWLSVGSLWGATYFTRWSDLRLGTGVLWRHLAGSIGATLATAPVTAASLGTVAIAGVILNFAGIPLAAIAVPGALASVVAAPVSATVSRALGAGTGIAFLALDRVAAAGAALPFGHLSVPSGFASALPWVGVLGVALWALGRRNTAAIAVTRVLAAAAAGLWALLVMQAGVAGANGRGPVLRLDFLDVGQGDATVIRTPRGHAILVDAGPRFGGRDAGRSIVAPFLARAGVGRLDAVILSHAHLDHFGGIPAVLDRIPAPLLLEPGEPVADSAYLAMLDAAAVDGVRWAPLRAGDTLRVDGVELVVLHPDTTWREWGLDLNEDSAVLLLRWGTFEALLAGDAGIPAEGRMGGRAGDVDLLKVGHHGSRGATGADWLEELRPEVAVVSVGARNRYGHPSAEALRRLTVAGASLWRTDRDGTVSVVVDSVRMTVRGGGRTEQHLLGAATHP